MISTFVFIFFLFSFVKIQEPVIVTKNKSFFLSGIGMLCGMSSKLLNIVARIPVRGYTPRQIIHLELFVNNMTGKSVSEFKVQLIKVSVRKYAMLHFVSHQTNIMIVDLFLAN